MTRPKLRVVESNDAALRRLFAERDRLAALMRDVDAEILSHVVIYARERGLMMLPREEAVRREVHQGNRA